MRLSDASQLERAVDGNRRRVAPAAMKGFSVRSVDALPPDERGAIIAGLQAYNADYGAMPIWQEVSAVARDRSGAVVGGLLGETGHGWLFVMVLWVADAYRGQGIGSALLAQAEREARRRKCIGVYLDTYSFQARPFYERLGYRLFGTLPDCPPGSTKYYLYKRLDGPRRSMKQSRLTRARHAMPADVRRALTRAGVTSAYRARPDYQQNDYLGWITRAKLPATRARRIDQMLAELAAGDRYMNMPYRATPKRAVRS